MLALSAPLSEHHQVGQVFFCTPWCLRRNISIKQAIKFPFAQAKLFQAAAEGAVRIKRRRGPRRGEDFTLTQALIKADFWLLFFSLLLGAGSGLTVIDNLGQMSESLGYDETHIFVSMISIWNFLGRIAGGYFSEIITR